MRRALILAGILTLMASIAYALSDDMSSDIDIVGSKAEALKIVASCEDVKLDIIGSTADNVKIVTPGRVGDIEIVGSKTSDIAIYSGVKEETHKKPCPPKPHCRPVYYAMGVNCDTPECNPCPPVNYGGHMGVDAWHGTYWYASGINTPKWPQVFGGV